jgi:hypothetical protein
MDAFELARAFGACIVFIGSRPSAHRQERRAHLDLLRFVL